MPIADKKLLRIVDANFNRTKEGLRVCEDVCRFYLDDPKASKQFKSIRHLVSKDVLSLNLNRLVESRDVERDVGRSSSRSEFKRKDVADVFYANSQRVKESIRVLEEVTKILNTNIAEKLKKTRYKIYGLEKKIIERL